MWPQALQMTRDECRAILRRLELETYSQVISVFRAQGGLSEPKAKLLEELRHILHISPDRHRAEARRVANDEELSTIGDAISGPNTTQDWSREGRRSFPMLPRVAPQTALALIANSVAAEVAAKNAKLPYPSDTAAAAAEEQAEILRETVAKGRERNVNVVTSDPFKIPDIPAGVVGKKSFKRSFPENHTGSNKKRNVNTPPKQQRLQQKLYPHITANTKEPPSPPGSNIRKLYNNHKSPYQKQSQSQLGQKLKVAIKKPTVSSKKQSTPAKSGRKSQKLAEQQKAVQQQTENQESTQQQHTTGTLISELQMGETQSEAQDQVSALPQIAASKKDITKNLSKIQIPATARTSSPASIRIAPYEQPVLGNSPTRGTSTPPITLNKIEKQIISSPVQKYIVEDRQSPSMVLQTPSAQQVLTIPHIATAGNKLRTVNTTILPPGSKMATKRLLSSTVVTSTAGTVPNDSMGEFTSNSSSSGLITSQPKIFNIIGSGVTNTSSGTIVTPTHAPPSIIQIQNKNIGIMSADSTQQPSQGKVLTTKLLPIVLSNAGGSGTTIIGSNTSNITKSLNNGATIIAASPGTITKTLTPTLLMSGQSASSTLATSFSQATSIYRRAANIKSSVGISGSGNILGSGLLSTKTSTYNTNLSSNSGGPTIISNIKLTPAITTTPVVPIQQSQIYQQKLTSIPPGTVRYGTNMKFAHTLNGKVFLQSANIDAAKNKLQGALHGKLISNTLSGGTIGGSSSSGTQQRISIQKVQIIPAPISSSTSNLSTSTQATHQQPKSTVLTTGNKSNMIFMSTASTRTTPGGITMSKGSFVSSGNNITTKISGGDASKRNVLVLGTTNMPQSHQSVQKVSSTSMPIAKSQMITEDTPIDILNMPIIVDSTEDISASSTNVGDTVSMLPSNIINNATHHQSSMQQQQSAVILGVTDWEIELDQAAATASKLDASSRLIEQQHSLQTDNDTIIIDDSYDDVIVEEQVDGDDGVASPTAISNDDIIVLDDEKDKSDDIDMHAETERQIDDDDPIVVIDDEQKNVVTIGAGNMHNTIMVANEYEPDAGFDETIDETNAVEYTSDEHGLVYKDNSDQIDEMNASELNAINCDEDASITTIEGSEDESGMTEKTNARICLPTNNALKSISVDVDSESALPTTAKVTSVQIIRPTSRDEQ